MLKYLSGKKSQEGIKSSIDYFPKLPIIKVQFKFKQQVLARLWHSWMAGWKEEHRPWFMDFTLTSYFNNFYGKELIFWVWNIKVLGPYLTELSYYGTLICAPLKTDPHWGGYVLFTPRTDSETWRFRPNS